MVFFESAHTIYLNQSLHFLRYYHLRERKILRYFCDSFVPFTRRSQERSAQLILSPSSSDSQQGHGFAGHCDPPCIHLFLDTRRQRHFRSVSPKIQRENKAPSSDFRRSGYGDCGRQWAIVNLFIPLASDKINALVARKRLCETLCWSVGPSVGNPFALIFF